MNNAIQIREYTENDRAAVLSLLRMNTPAHFSPEEEKDLQHYLDHEIDEYFVVGSEGEIIGCGGINYSEDGATGKISWDMLHPDHQRKGIGKLLLEFRINKLKEKKHIRSITVRTSQLAWKFYGKNGFKLLEVVKDHWAKGYDMYKMEYIDKNI